MQGSQPGVNTESMLQGFLSLGIQFVNASVDVWPDDKVLLEWKTIITETANKHDDDAMRNLALDAYNEFHMALAPHYESIRNKNESLFEENIDVFKTLHANEKWKGADEHLRNTVWDYLTELSQFASMYSMYKTCPDQIMSKVNTLAQSLASRIEKGEMTTSDINPLKLSQEIVSQMNAKDLDEFASNFIHQNNGGIQGVFGMLNGMVGKMAGNTGFGNISQILQSSGGGGDSLSSLPSMMNLINGKGLQAGARTKNPFSKMFENELKLD